MVSTTKLAIVAILGAFALILTSCAISLSIILQHKRQVIAKKQERERRQQQQEQEIINKNEVSNPTLTTTMGTDTTPGQQDERYARQRRQQKQQQKRRRITPTSSYDAVRDIGSHRRMAPNPTDARTASDAYLSRALQLATGHPFGDESRFPYSPSGAPLLGGAEELSLLGYQAFASGAEGSGYGGSRVGGSVGDTSSSSSSSSTYSYWGGNDNVGGGSGESGNNGYGFRSYIESNSILRVMFSPLVLLEKALFAIGAREKMFACRRWFIEFWGGRNRVFGGVSVGGGGIGAGGMTFMSGTGGGGAGASSGGGGGGTGVGGTGRNDTEALYYLQKSAELGNPHAQYWLGHALATGVFEGKPVVVVDGAAPSSSSSSSSAKRKTTTLLPVPGDIGEGGANLGRALVLWHMAAIEGVQEAQMALGYRYAAAAASSGSGGGGKKNAAGISGRAAGGGGGVDVSYGVPGDCLTALAYYEEAANAAMDEMEAGPLRGKVTPATDRHRLAEIHMHGASSALSPQNKPDELDEALEFLRIRATHAQDAQSAFTLATFHHYGLRGVDQDMRLALKYYEMAAMAAVVSSTSSPTATTAAGTASSDSDYGAESEPSTTSPSSSLSTPETAEFVNVDEDDDEDDEPVLYTDMPEAAGQAAKLHILGMGVAADGDLPDMEAAYKFMRMGAPGGLQNCSLPEEDRGYDCDPAALNVFGLAHLWGLSVGGKTKVGIDRRKAVRYFNLARDLGSIEASYNLAMMRMGWNNVHRDDENLLHGSGVDHPHWYSGPDKGLQDKDKKKRDDKGTDHDNVYEEKGDDNSDEEKIHANMQKQLDRLLEMAKQVESELEDTFDAFFGASSSSSHSVGRRNDRHHFSSASSSSSGSHLDQKETKEQFQNRQNRVREMISLLNDVQEDLERHYHKYDERLDELVSAVAKVDSDLREAMARHETFQAMTAIDGIDDNAKAAAAAAAAASGGNAKQMIYKKREIQRGMQKVRNTFARIRNSIQRKKQKKVKQEEKESSSAINRFGVDYGKALNDFSRAAMKGHLQSMHRVGVMHARGYGTAKNCPTALNYLRQVAEASPAIGRRMRQAYKSYKAGRVDVAVRNYLSAAEAGVELAQSNAAWLLERGYCLGLDRLGCVNASLRMWRAASRQGNAEASLRVGDFHYYGRLNGIEDDEDDDDIMGGGGGGGGFESVRWEWPFLISYMTHPELWVRWTRSSAISLVRRGLRMAKISRGGSGSIVQRKSSVVEVEKEAANTEESEREFVDEDSRRAATCEADDDTCNADAVEQASEAGGAPDISSLTGTSSSKKDARREHNFNMAVHYYRKAAEAKSPRANFNLGFMYEWGLGLKQDFPLAKRHYDLAAANHAEAALAVKIALWSMNMHERLARGARIYEERHGNKSYWQVGLILLSRRIGLLAPDGDDDETLFFMDEAKRKILVSHLYNWETGAIVILTVLLCGLVQHYLSKRKKEQEGRNAMREQQQHPQ